MNMKTFSFTKWAVVAVAVTVLSGTIYSFAATGNDSTGPARERIRAALKSLDLSDSQRTQVRSVFKENGPTLQPLVKQLVAERRTLRGIIQTVPVDEAAIRAEAAKVATIEADLDVQRAQVSQSIQKILTPEQGQKFRELQSKFDERVDAGLGRFAKWSAQP